MFEACSACPNPEACTEFVRQAGSNIGEMARIASQNVGQRSADNQRAYENAVRLGREDVLRTLTNEMLARGCSYGNQEIENFVVTSVV